MYHSISFGDGKGTWKNTWDDWKIVPSSRPVVAPPEPKTNYIDIPGANGSLDFSEALSGTPTYGDREGTFEFIVMNGYNEWTDLYDELSSYVNGKKLLMQLEDEPEYIYLGRFTLDNWDSTKAPRSIIKIKYRIEPTKTSTGGAAPTFVPSGDATLIKVIKGSVDSELSLTSTNPVQNKLITKALQDQKITIDSILKLDSKNPVENKAISKALQKYTEKYCAQMKEIDEYLQSISSQVTGLSYDEGLYFIVDDQLNKWSSNLLKNVGTYDGIKYFDYGLFVEDISKAPQSYSLVTDSFTIEGQLDDDSTNPIQNKAIYYGVANFDYGLFTDIKPTNSNQDIIIDDLTFEHEIDRNSNNPVQNKSVFCGIYDFDYGNF